MEMIIMVLIVYFLIGAGVCLLICVNPNDPGIMGKLSRLVFVTIPPIFSGFIRKLFGERALNCLGGCKTYLMDTNHPIVQVFYLLIAVGGFIAYECLGIFRHMPNRLIGDFHVVTANVLAMVCFWIYYKACATSPGQVTLSNNKQYTTRFQQYYDGLLYKKNNKCPTCTVIKPARSKHCSVCKMCVSKFDHHCIWYFCGLFVFRIRQCVGEKNYKYFVSFLFLHAIWCLYLSFIGTVSLYEYIDKSGFMRMQFKRSNQIVKATPMLAVQYLFMTETIFFFLIVMCLIMGVTLLIFVTYHFYLIGQGCTTNERVKINDETDYLNKQIKNITKIEKSNPGMDRKTEVQYRNQKVPFEEIQQYKSECQRRLAILEKKMPSKGFFGNLVDVFKL